MKQSIITLLVWDSLILMMPHLAYSQTDKQSIIPVESASSNQYAYEHFGDLKVTAEGYKNHDSSFPKTTIPAEVHINGKYVGTAPFQDGLPRGVYIVDVIDQHEQKYSEKVSIKPGESITVSALFTIPPTKEENAALEQRRKEEQAAIQKKALEEEQELQREREKREKEMAELWKKKHEAWKADVARIKDEREPWQYAAYISGGVGIGLIVAGTVFELVASSDDRKARRYASAWEQSTNAKERANYIDRINQVQDERSTYNALGISLLSGGATAIVAGIFIFILLPSYPEKPKLATNEQTNPLPSLEIMPKLSIREAGATLTWSF
jgi:hypothetical protein